LGQEGGTLMLRFIEGFEGFGNVLGANITNLLKLKSTNTGPGPFYLDTGRNGGYSIYSGSTGQDQWFGFSTGATTNTIYLGWAMKPTGGTTAVAVFYFYGSSGVAGSIRWGTVSSGELSFHNYQGTVLGTTSGAGLAPGGNVWKYVEAKIVVGTGTSGSVQIKVDGVTKLTLTGVNTSNTGGDTVYNWFNTDATSQYRIDDMYLCDSSGSVNNNFLGPQTVIGLLPAGDTASADWTPLSGTDHYQQVNEAAADGDAGYVEDGTSGHMDLFRYHQLSALDAIAGIQINTICRQTDATPLALKTPVKSGGITSEEASQSIGGTSYGCRTRVLEIDPGTSAAWTQAGLNAAEIGVKVG
jgi:hypothetical protein